ncbi:MAG: hypothetical protein JRN15_15330, partial [Nitrososphaerota archaeon]|nr:hypothetical protein [Nitrososphaerota archaeon]
MIRNKVSWVGIVAIGYGEILRAGLVSNILISIGVVSLMTAAAMLMKLAPTRVKDEDAGDPLHTVAWRWTLIVLAIAGAIVAQTWFITGTVIADGDIGIPIGTAWIGRLFQSYGWGLNNLGAPTNNQIQLPWAGISWVTHLLGGTGALAQRVWFTLLISSIIVLAGALARTLRYSPAAGVAVAVWYFFNPFTMSWVSFADTYLVTAALIPALAAAVVSYGQGRIREYALVIVFLVSAPFLGYASGNVPLLGLVVATTCFSPLLAWARFGRDSAKRSLRAVLLGGIVAIGASAYWLVPSAHIVGVVSYSNFQSLSSWLYQEALASVTNGLWLNTFWAWPYSYYYPFSHLYLHFPMILATAIVPVGAFSAIVVSSGKGFKNVGAARLTGLIGVSALTLILFGTGTRSPGSVLFDPLYHLPFGWLLQEPGRFLEAAALGYALLVGQVVDCYGVGQVKTDSRWSWKSISEWMSSHSRPVITSFGLVSLALLSAFPLWTGAEVPGARQGFPTAHVKVPNYWYNMARYLNSSKAPVGSMLALPPDAFYLMSYKWYYGNDGFIANLLTRHVLVPSGQGYEAASPELLSAVQLESSALLSRRWTEASRLLAAMDTRLILVRGDVRMGFPIGRLTDSPSVLASRLQADPMMALVRHFGPLSIYMSTSRHFGSVKSFATVNRREPNLTYLSLVPKNSALVYSPPIQGKMALFVLPSLYRWNLHKLSIATTIKVPLGRRYSLIVAGGGSAAGAKLSLVKTRRTNAYLATVRIPFRRSLIENGEFTQGVWNKVGNCNINYHTVVPPNYLNARVVLRGGPQGIPALRLAATVDSACEQTNLKWREGTFLLSLRYRSLAGLPPRMCVFEHPLMHCATVPQLSEGEGWKRYVAMVRPDPVT